MFVHCTRQRQKRKKKWRARLEQQEEDLRVLCREFIRSDVFMARKGRSMGGSRSFFLRQGALRARTLAARWSSCERVLLAGRCLFLALRGSGKGRVRFGARRCRYATLASSAGFFGRMRACTCCHLLVAWASLVSLCTSLHHSPAPLSAVIYQVFFFFLFL